MRRSVNLFAFLLFLYHVTTIVAQCEAPVPCQDDELNRLNTTDCHTYHAFIARGSDSGYPGHLGGLIKLICNNLTASESDVTCGYENVVYPANSTAWGKNAWCWSAGIGAEAGQAQMKEYADRCPDAKLIVLGFSQGGSVALDMLGGGGGDVFECVQDDNPPMNREILPGKNVVAAAVFGAVRRSPSQDYSTKGGSNYTGTAPRTSEQLAGLDPYSEILRDYCNFGDPICAVGSEPKDVKQHLNYFELYNEEAMDFIVRTAGGEKVKPGDERVNVTASVTASVTDKKAAQASATPTKMADGNEQEDKTSAAVGLVAQKMMACGAVLAALIMIV